MKLEYARLCLDCREVFDQLEGGRLNLVCPGCGSRQSDRIEPWLNRADNNSSMEVTHVRDEKESSMPERKVLHGAVLVCSDAFLHPGRRAS